MRLDKNEWESNVTRVRWAWWLRSSRVSRDRRPVTPRGSRSSLTLWLNKSPLSPASWERVCHRNRKGPETLKPRRSRSSILKLWTFGYVVGMNRLLNEFDWVKALVLKSLCAFDVVFRVCLILCKSAWTTDLRSRRDELQRLLNYGYTFPYMWDATHPHCLLLY